MYCVCFYCNIDLFQMFEKYEGGTENKEYMIKRICSPSQIEKCEVY